MKNAIIDYAQEQTQQLLDQIVVMRENNHEPETVHSLRLSVKRLGGIFRFVDTIAGNKKVSKAAKPIRQIFARAGKLRDIQVQELLVLQLATSVGVPVSEFLYFLMCEKKHAKLHFVSAQNINLVQTVADLNAQIKQTLEPLDNETLNEAVETYIGTLQNDIDEAFASLDSEKTVHNIRHKYKELNYLLSIYKSIQPDEKYADYKQLKKQCAKLGKTLGKWHDYVVLKDLLEEADDDSGGALLESASQYFHLFDMIEQKKTRYLEKFVIRYQRTRKV